MKRVYHTWRYLNRGRRSSLGFPLAASPPPDEKPDRDSQDRKPQQRKEDKIAHHPARHFGKRQLDAELHRLVPALGVVVPHSVG